MCVGGTRVAALYGRAPMTDKDDDGRVGFDPSGLAARPGGGCHAAVAAATAPPGACKYGWNECEMTGGSCNVKGCADWGRMTRGRRTAAAAAAGLAAATTEDDDADGCNEVGWPVAEAVAA